MVFGFHTNMLSIWGPLRLPCSGAGGAPTIPSSRLALRLLTVSVNLGNTWKIMDIPYSLHNFMET